MARRYHDVTQDICYQVEAKPPISAGWRALSVALVLLGVFFYSVYRTLWYGIGEWGLNKTVGWAWDITNFVWWARYRPRRYAHLGRAFAVPAEVALVHQPGGGSHDDFRRNLRRHVPGAAHGAALAGYSTCSRCKTRYGSLWANFNSPLLWDVFAISTYFTVSLVFWYTGLVPDFATIRDRAKGKIARFSYSMLSMGWTGSAKALVALRDGIAHSGRRFYAAGTVGTHHRIDGLCHFRSTGLAHYYLPALLRGRGYLLGFRDGAHAHAGYPRGV